MTVAKPNQKKRHERAQLVIEQLKSHYPDAHCALHYKNPFELLIATILSAQCTDERVNIVTRVLFAKYPTPEALSKASLSQIEKIIYSAGFYKNKAKSLKSCATALVEHHGSQVPKNLDELTLLAGVGRKTANVVLGNAYGITSGVVVDTHVGRLSKRLGWVKSNNPVLVERELMELVLEKDWIMISHYLISHGRTLCKARKPLCEECFLFDQCLRIGV